MSKHKKETPANEELNKAEQLADNQDNTSAYDEQTTLDNHLPDDAIIKLESLTSSYNELNDKYLRLFSEFDNYRKRTLKEKVELSKTASAEIIKAVLPVVDDLERAISNFPESDNNSHFEGIKLIYSNLKRILEQQGLEETKALGEPFDTDFHEAVTHIPAALEQDKGKVVEVIKKGYSLHGKIIRFAQVIVGS